MGQQVFFSTLGLGDKGLNMSGFRQKAALTPKEQALQAALTKGLEHVEIFSEDKVLAFGKEAQQLFLKGETEAGLSPAEVLDLSKATQDIASLTPLLIKGEDGKEATVYARPKAELKKAEDETAKEAEKKEGDNDGGE
jgi:hypothetical protein